ncbi:S-layer family protein [Phormidium sp. CCY1219]|uniref:S-layer family protein n=1 Tax=Phormidium sp. CCY1219 TaxID=2886104 RepID=UPI002D1F66CA|nr:S-layer family protein [Phormidium sp. CCY1219]MEB3830259.1 S-layer family protein [Phormidium sp. CCY1219]
MPFAFHAVAQGQIIPDRSLPSNSEVTPQGNSRIITGGTQRGGNLFHSFKEFSLPTNRVAQFENQPNIQNIVTRVTGGKISQIDGLIQTNGSANLFLLNPNGIVFGPNAQLNIGGSFVATSAEAIELADGTTFGGIDPEAPPLLTISTPVGLQFGENPGAIINRSRATDSSGAIARMQVTPGQTLALIGGHVTLEGGQMQAPSGRIHIGSVGDKAKVSLRVTENGIAAGYESVGDFRDIQLLQQSVVSTSGQGGGSVELQGRQIQVRDGSQVLAIARGAQPGGTLRLQAKEFVEISGTNPENFTIIASDTMGTGAGGDLTVETRQFLLQGTAFLSTTAFGEGAGGNLSVRAIDGVNLIGIGLESLNQFLGGGLSGQLQPSDRISGLFAGTAGLAPGGNITIQSDRIGMYNGAIAFNPTFGSAPSGEINLFASHAIEAIGAGAFTNTALGSTGSAGNLTIQTSQLTIRDGSVFSTATLGNGAGGDILIRASESVEVSRTLPGTLLPTGILNNTLFGIGIGGDIRIETKRLINRQGALIVANSGGIVGTDVIPLGGPGGNILIEASESIEILGVSADGFTTSGPGTTTFTDSPAGDLTLITGTLSIGDGAIPSSASLGEGAGGTLTVNASESVEVFGTSPITGLPTTVVASSGRADLPQVQAIGAGGDVRITTPELRVRDGASLDVRSLGAGNAGTLEIVAGSVRLEREGSLNAATVSGAGGNIQVRSPDIRLSDRSSITTNAGNTNGGNITIDTETLTALNNSDITANALEGRGGRVSITAEGIFGTEFRSAPTPASDITATSQLGPQFSGTVEINTPETDSSLGIVELESAPVDVSKLIAQNFCVVGQGSEFTITGRGGLPTSPNEALDASVVLEDLRIVPTSPAQTSQPPSPSPALASVSPSGQRLVEAQGWAINAQGKVVLVAQPTSVTPHSDWMSLPGCGKLYKEPGD